jgi:type I restriction enzyme S subunit
MSGDAPTVPLDHLVELRTDKVAANKDPELPYVGLEQIAEGEPHLLGTLSSSASRSTNSIFAAGDILFGKLRPNLRKSIRVDFAGYCSTDILVLRPRHGVFPGYVAHLFQWDRLINAAVATAEGTRMPRTSWSELSRLSVSLPPYSDQIAIAQVLDRVDEAISHARADVSKLEMMRGGLISDLLRRGVSTDGALRPENSRDFADSELGRVPNSWDVVKLRVVASVQGGKRLPAGHEYAKAPTSFRYLRVLDFFDRDVDFDRLVSLSPTTFRVLERYEIRPGDVYISIAGSLGYAGVSHQQRLTGLYSRRTQLGLCPGEGSARRSSRCSSTDPSLSLRSESKAASAAAFQSSLYFA